jgi:bacterial surface protein 26-residue repeat/bacterial surface protein 26-residue repeat
MQEFREILETDTVSDSREYINKGLQTLRSNFAGEAFPTENLAVGMKCYRTDKGRTYTLKSLDPLLWEEDGSAVKREDMTNSQLFTEAMTREALKNITDWSHFFSKLPVMEFLDLSPYPIDNATKLEYLFANDFMLKSVTGLLVNGGRKSAYEDSPENQWEHPARTSSFEGMFYRCESLSALDGEIINTRGVENLKEMFAYCRRLEKLATGHWRTMQCKTMAGMFKGCEKLEEIDVSKWDVSNVEDFSSLFEGCKRFKGVERVDWNNEILTNMPKLDAWATTKAKSMANMFKDCVNIQELNLSNFDLRNVENASGMFQNCYGLQRIVCGEHTFSTGKVKDFSRMFDDCGLQSFGTYEINKWKEDWTVLSKMDFSSAENMEAMLRNTRLCNETCYVGSTSRFDAFWLDFAQYNPWKNYWTVRGLFLRINAPKVKNIAQMLEGCMADGIYLEMDTSKAVDMRRLFAKCYATCIRLKGVDTQNSIENIISWAARETGIAHIFQGCRSLRFLILDSQEFTFKLEHKDSYNTYREDIFADLSAECRVLVPKALLPTYRAAPVWKDYAERIEAIEDYEFIGSDSMFVLRRRPTAEEHVRIQDKVTFRKV